MANEQDYKKIIQEQEKQIASLKGAVTILERRLILLERRERSRDAIVRQSKTRLDLNQRKVELIESTLRG